MAGEGENHQAQNAETKAAEVVKEEKKEEPVTTPDATEKKDDKPEAKKEKKAPMPPKPVVHKPDFEKDIVYLYQFSRTALIPSLSPFCLKVETWLRLNGVKYENVDHKMKHRSKKGLLPFVELNGEEIADSSVIIKDLGKRFSKDMDAGLSSEQKIISHTTSAMIENHLFWVLYWWRSKYPGQFLKGAKFNIQQALGSKMPAGLLNFLFKFRFKQGQKKVMAHGLGVHKPEEIEEFGRNDLRILSELLGDKDYFLGTAEPTTLDVNSFAFLSQFIYFDKEVDFPLKTWLEENAKNLVAFVDRIKCKAFPDWDEMCKTLDLNSHLPKPPPPPVEEKKEVATEEAIVKEDTKKKDKKKKEEKKSEEQPAKEEKKEEPEKVEEKKE